MNIVRVAFVELRVKDVQASLAFYQDLLGFVVAHREGNQVYLRGYEELEWSLKLVQAPLPAAATVGFKVAREQDLEELAHWAQEQGLPWRWSEEWARPRVLQMQSPFGHPLSFFASAQKLPRLLQAYHLYRGPGVQRLDHVNFFSSQVGAEAAFWQEVFRFRLTEYTEDDHGRLWACWLQRKGNVHDLALTNGLGPRLHHLAYWVPEAGAVLRAADILAGAARTEAIERGPGRHGISNAMFLYLRDPDGHRLELYTGDYLAVDPDHPPLRWSLNDPRRQTLWGHKAPASWFSEGSLFLGWGGDPVPLQNPPSPGIPEHVL
jgi:catechol 2,3-dioxygenase